VKDAVQLLSPDGQRLLEFLAGQEVNPDSALRLAEELRGRYPPGMVAAALTQQTLRQAARDKFSRAGDMLFTRAGLEQASSELTAAHSARRFRGLETAADLCCGIGGNLAALAAAAGRVLAVDADLTSLMFAMRNVTVLRPAARVVAVCADVRDLALAGRARDASGRGSRASGSRASGSRARDGCVQAVFIDPARRTSQGRLRAGDSQPPLDWCVGLAAQAPAVCIKAAPGLPRELVPAGWELEFLAVGRELKEALLWSPAFATAPRRASVLRRPDPAGHRSGTPGRDAAAASLISSPAPAALAPAPVADPGEYLLDPNPAVTRAGLVAELARELGAWQIDSMIAFLSVDRPVSTPFARTLRVIDSMPWHERQAARRLRELGIGSADIRRRGLAGDVQQIHHRLRLQGDKHATIVLTRRNGKPWSLICADVPDAGKT
jgi:THUMP domain-like/RNA cap guanine-N2 methyltransferase